VENKINLSTCVATGISPQENSRHEIGDCARVTSSRRSVYPTSKTESTIKGLVTAYPQALSVQGEFGNLPLHNASRTIDTPPRVLKTLLL
jgi:hypothetical protein